MAVKYVEIGLLSVSDHQHGSSEPCFFVLSTSEQRRKARSFLPSMGNDGIISPEVLQKPFETEASA